ncbi:FAD/NAD(P)-binding domain-containing protein [Pholiota conissans]|uniref:FAD/NAD(P)-binding domain-containing protein n=1 Tax=Pholiota conissans TaxID=109636 RepID=A0A9P5ZCI0_9AGAR|nr:FAD/NAD(P)-binding domain-containing protein [Pholiota conissans]
MCKCDLPTPLWVRKASMNEGLLVEYRLLFQTTRAISNNMQNDVEFDIAVVGGGPAGCAFSLSLFGHSHRLSCLLIDDSDPRVFKIGESLPPEAVRLLHHLSPSLPKALTAQVLSGVHSLCTGNASAWASSIVEERHAILNPFGHGLHLDRATFDETMRETVIQLSLKDPRLCFLKGRVVDLQLTDQRWAICVNVGDETRAIKVHWVVDATGRRASLATKLGRTILSPNPLLAFYALFVGPSFPDPAEGDNDSRTLIEATSDGWFYSSLISRNPCTRIVAFHTLPTHPAAKQSRRRDGFIDLLTASAPLISRIVHESDYTMARDGGYPRCTAAGTSYLDKTCDSKAQWIAVGDSASAFDPLSSQGIMTSLEMGFYIGAMLAHRIEEDDIERDFDDEIDKMYRAVRLDYERHRGYYYGIVERFKGEMFWQRGCALLLHLSRCESSLQDGPSASLQSSQKICYSAKVMEIQTDIEYNAEDDKITRIP